MKLKYEPAEINIVEFNSENIMNQVSGPDGVDPLQDNAFRTARSVFGVLD